MPRTHHRPRTHRAATLALAALFSLVALATARAFDAAPAITKVTPSDADPAIHAFDEPTYVFVDKTIADKTAAPATELVLFLPGTHGKPADRQLLRVIAGLGYRVINLQYNDDISVNPACPREGTPECSAHLRADRIYGDGGSTIAKTPPAETIVNRLVKTLRYLDAHEPGAHWGDYLAGDAPNWPRFVVSGLSQGAGMAAYIAKQHEVARVVLFSSPADYVFDESRPDGSRPAPWLSTASATPMARWYAEYHAREKAAARLKDAYAALAIPADHILVFDLDTQPGARGNNPFHGSTILNPGYEPQWRTMFGQAAR